ncbi:MAG: hypothetical protein U9N77_04335 [Thermodesulfobacteriota bacterium]|nr:hypothetical protein [Thermodesulfobacteriota bacterium]
MPNKKSLGEILIQKNLVAPEKIEQALHVQTGGNRRLGYILIKMGLINEEELFSALSEQQGIPLADLEKNIAKEPLGLLPRYLCKKHSILPLSIEENNILNLAMINPLDQASRDDAEAFSGMVVKPFLAKEKKIEQAINHHMPLGIKDLFYPLIYNRTAKITVILFLILSVALAFFINREIQLNKYGTISVAGDLKVFSNHEMLIGVEGKGAISLIGHGPYAKGFYSVVFNNKKKLKTFVKQKKKFLSNEQLQWVNWVINEKID